MMKRYIPVMAIPLLVGLTSCIIVQPNSSLLVQPPTVMFSNVLISPVILPGIVPCQNTPMPSIASCMAAFTIPFNPVDYFDEWIKKLQKANAVVGVLIELGEKAKKFYDFLTK